jgi:hypothetical protein
MMKFTHFLSSLAEATTIQRVARTLFPRSTQRKIEQRQAARGWAAVRRAQEKKLAAYEARKAARKAQP